MAGESVVYQIDSNDIIVSVNDAWGGFAQENDWQVPTDTIIGQSLWRYIAGVDVAQIYRELLCVVRERQSAVRIPFRCDSPTVRRNMVLDAIPQSDGAIEFRTTTLNVQQQPAAFPSLHFSPQTDFEPITKDSALRLCSWCKRLYVAGEWVELADGVKALGLFQTRQPAPITHAMCTDCYIRINSELEP